MLVATRDPMAQHDAAVPAGAAHSRVGRLMLVMQLVGSFLAIPVGLASGYSIYRANFSPETTCQALRSSIVSMIDKQIDAPTRRMLVRRDVEEFEKTCGTVDPDAEAAFKALLASDPPLAATPTAQTVQPLALPAQEWKKPEPVQASKPQVRETKEAKEKEPAHEARVQPSDAADDARWLGAVRHALTAHQIERAAAEATVKPLVPPVAAHSAPVTITPATPVAVAPAIAPTLPPPASITASPEPGPARAELDHPVPPGSIPDAATTGSIASQTSWTDHIPFFGR
jgi:hypothetical protein